MLELHTFEFHIAGTFQDPHLEYYTMNVINELHNVWYYGWTDQKDEWLEGVDYLISPSIVESFGYSIAEAMCKGIKPLIHHRPGAIWPETWRTMDDLELMIDKNSPYESDAYRQHIINNFSIEQQMLMTEQLINSFMPQPKGIHLDFAQEAPCLKIVT